MVTEIRDRRQWVQAAAAAGYGHRAAAPLHWDSCRRVQQLNLTIPLLDML